MLLLMKFLFIKFLHNVSINIINVIQSWFILDGNHKAHPMTEVIHIRQDMLLIEHSDKFSISIIISDIQGLQWFANHGLNNISLGSKKFIERLVIILGDINHTSVKSLTNSINNAVQEIINFFNKLLSVSLFLGDSELFSTSAAPDEQDRHDRTLVWCLYGSTQSFLELSNVLSITKHIDWDMF